MGLNMSGDEYCYISDIAPDGIQNTVKIVDDMLTYGPTFNEHVQHVWNVLFQRCEHGITLNPQIESKGGGAPCEPMAILIQCPTVSADVLLQLGYFLVGGWWQDLHFGHRKTLHSRKTFQKHKKKCKNPLQGSTSCAASLRRGAHRMTGLGQSLRDRQSLMIGGKPRGNIPGSDCGRVSEWC